LNSDTTMVSRRLDLTVVNSGNFGVTAFGYSSEAGGGFKPFGAQSNLPKAGTRTMKAGGQVRAGPFSFGFAESSIENTQPLSFGLEDSNIENIDNVAQLAAVQQELSATLDLPQLVGSQVSTGFFSTLLPTLWVASNDQHTLASGQGSVPGGTSTTSFGGSWTWNHGYASLGYWNAGNEGAAASAWSGSGLDASFGGYYSSFGIDVSLSYGGSADIAPAWQSAGALYNSSVTVSYKPESPNLPDIWASAAAGNYNQNSIPYGGTSSAFSDMYDTSAKGEYWSIATGLDFTRLFWTPDTAASDALTGEHPSFKLLYQYTDGLYLDSSGSAGTTRSADNLVAVMIHRRF
jgi:hypothetical protein